MRRVRLKKEYQNLKAIKQKQNLLLQQRPSAESSVTPKRVFDTSLELQGAYWYPGDKEENMADYGAFEYNNKVKSSILQEYSEAQRSSRKPSIFNKRHFSKFIDSMRSRTSMKADHDDLPRRFEEEDLEEWRQNLLTDKLYFMSATNRKHRRKLMESVPEFIKNSKPRIENG